MKSLTVKEVTDTWQTVVDRARTGQAHQAGTIVDTWIMADDRHLYRSLSLAGVAAAFVAERVQRNTLAQLAPEERPQAAVCALRVPDGACPDLTATVQVVNAMLACDNSATMDVLLAHSKSFGAEGVAAVLANLIEMSVAVDQCTPTVTTINSTGDLL
jgi:hypothetical protein